MNRIYLKFSALFLVGTFLVSCGDDDKVNPNKPEFPDEFSELTVEQNKENLETNGINLINSITDLKDAKGIQTFIAFEKHIDGSEGLENLEGGRKSSNHGVGIARLLAAFGNNKSSAYRTLSHLRVKEDDFISFEDEFNSAVGVYTYSKANDAWTYEDTGSKIVFKFPSTEAATTNDAEFSIFGYTGVDIESNLGGDDYTGDFPTALQAELKVGGTKAMGYSFSASYNGNGDPKTVSMSFEIDEFELSYDVKNTVEEVSVNYALTENGNNLISFGAMSTGNFDSGAAEGGDVGDVVNYAGAYFQIMNIKFSGEVDADKLVESLNGAETIEDEAAAWNANYKLMAFYADSKEKIAETEYYVTTRTETYYDCYEWYNDQTEEWEYACDEYENEYDVLDIRLVFKDGSKADLETYTEVGFNDLEDELEAFFDDID